MQFIRELAGKEELELEDENEFISSILSEISSVKGEMIDFVSCISTFSKDTALLFQINESRNES